MLMSITHVDMQDRA